MTQQAEIATEEHQVAPEQIDQAKTNDATRDDLIAAVREAGGTASVDVDAEEAAAKAKAEAATSTTEAAEEEPRINALLRAREKATAEREAARNHADELIAQARRESERMITEARERADREWQAEIEKKRQAFASSPTEAVRALGDPQQIVDAVLRDGTPEGRALAQMQRELAETRAKAAEGSAAKTEIQKLREEVARDAYERQVSEVKSRFLTQHATPEKAKYAYAEHGTPEKVFAAGDAKAAEWQAQGLVLGKDFDFNDVAMYVEREAKAALERKLQAVGLTPAQQVSVGAPAREPGNAPKVPANGPRTLPAAQGSERRTSPKPLSEMKPDEARAALIEEVAAARRANPGTIY